MKTYSILFILVTIRIIETAYVIPDITIQALKPKGLRVLLPDSPKVNQFSFNANINQPLKGKEQGTISITVTEPENGFWQFVDRSIELKQNDILYYRIYVQNDRFGFDKLDQRFIVAELLTDGRVNTPEPECTASDTRINGGQTVCGNKLIFEDNFDRVDESKWTKEQFVAWSPDYEFVSYEKSTEHCYAENGLLHLRTLLRSDPYSPFLDLSNGCTGANCTIEAAGTILPPAVSGRLKSRFSFLYGKIEIKAQLPRGDWIYPQLFLEPKLYEYGPGYSSGRIWLAYSRGNQDLKTKYNEVIGNSVLYSGPVLAVKDPARTVAVKKIEGHSWGSQFHNYAITWSPEGISVSVDGDNKGIIKPPNGAFSSLKDTAHIPYAHGWTTSMAPFDKEFVIALGIGVGGRSDFPDLSSSNGAAKPWKNTNPRANLKMLEAKNQWFPSWAGDNSILKIDHIKVWSL